MLHYGEQRLEKCKKNELWIRKSGLLHHSILFCFGNSLFLVHSF